MTKKPPLNHLAIIMDGNGRWAKARGLSRLAGHRKGAKVLQEVVQACLTLQIPYLTFFAFSLENWQRPLEEVEGLMALFQEAIEAMLSLCHEKGICLRFIGRRSCLSPSIQDILAKVELQTKHYHTCIVQVALSYSGRDEIVRACQAFTQASLEGKYTPEALTEILFTTFLDTYPIPDPDLLLRTAEQRLSNFLLWQLAYTECLFIPKKWPAITAQDIYQALEIFQARQRRFGVL